MKTLKALFAVLHTARAEFDAGGTYHPTPIEAINDAIKAVALETAYMYKPRKRKGKALDANERSLAPSNKINAIKAYRERTGVGLLEAKNAVEDWMRANGYMS